MSIDNKFHSKEHLQELINDGIVIGEIPLLEGDANMLFTDPNDRNVIAESFRTLTSNLKYLLANEKDAKVILSTSSVKGEGKTFTAINTALALSSLDNKVLLIGCDLRNPQLHKYLDVDKSVPGLVNFLMDNSTLWINNVITKFDNMPNLDVLVSGALPPNPTNLLSNGNFEILLKQAKEKYDYILLDTAPTLLVTDTLIISSLVDSVIYVTRANFTTTDLIKFPNELLELGKIKNVGFVINALGAQNKYGYSYGYQYGYGYKYSYNYGYGYGYEEEKD